MEIKKTNFKNLIEIKFKKYSDKRGSFIKIFNKKNSNNFKNECYESYLSISKKGSSSSPIYQVGFFNSSESVYGELKK